MMKLLEKYKQMPVQVKASFWFLLCGFMTKGISVITTPIFTRILTTVEYGQFSVFNSWYGILSVFITMNLFSGVFTQGMVKNEKNRKKYASALQGLCFSLMLVWTFVYFCFHSYFNSFFKLNTGQMLCLILMSWLNASFNFWSVEQRIENKYKLLVFVTLFVTFAKPILGVFLVLHSSDKVTARIFGLLVIEIIAYSWTFIYQLIRGKQFFSFNYWMHAFKFNLPLIPHYLSMTILNSADRIMINDMVGAGAAGVYNLAYSVSQIMTIFNTALMQTIEPWLYKKIKNNQIEAISKVAISTFSLIACVNLCLMIFAPELIKFFAPASYYEAIWVIPPIAMSVYFMFSYTFFAVFEFYYEKTKYIMIATTTGAIINILLNYIFISKFGYIATGYTTLVCYILFSLFHFYFMRKMCIEHLNGKLPYDIRQLITVTLVFVLSSIVILITYNYFVIRYFIVVITFLILLVKMKEIFLFIQQLMNIKHSA